MGSRLVYIKAVDQRTVQRERRAIEAASFVTVLKDKGGDLLVSSRLRLCERDGERGEDGG